MHAAGYGRRFPDARVFGVDGRFGGGARPGDNNTFDAFVGRQLARDAADLDLLDGDGCLERRGGKIFAGGIHHIHPHGQREVLAEGAAENLARTVETHPHAAGHRFVVSEKPHIGEIVSRAGFTRRAGYGESVVGHGPAARAADHGIGEQTVHLPGGAVLDHLGPRVVALVDDLSVAVEDAVDDMRATRTRAASGKHGVGQRGFLEGQLARAEIAVGIGTQRRVDAGFLRELADRIEPGAETDPHRRRILAVHQRLAHRDFALVFVVRALHAPFAENARAAADADQAVIERPVLHDVPGKNTFLESGGENQRDKGCADRTFALHAAVVFAVEEVAAAHHDKDPARGVVQGEHRALQVIGSLGVRGPGLRPVGCVFAGEVRVSLVGIAATAFDVVQTPAQGFLGRLLHARIQGGMDAEPAVHRAIVAERGDGLLAHVVHGVGLFDRIRALADGERLGQGFRVLLPREEAEVAHLLEDVIAVRPRCLRVVPWRETVRTLEQTGQRGGLRGGHLGRGHPEITTGRRLRAVKSTAEVNAVEIKLHDLLLGETLLDTVREGDLEKLAAVGAFLEVERIAGQLLGDRAGPLTDPARGPVGHGGAGNAHVVHPVMRPEPLVLRGHHRVDQHLGKFVIRNGVAVLDEKLAHRLALAVVDQRGGLHPLETVEVELLGHLGEFRAHQQEKNGPDGRAGQGQQKRSQPEPAPRRTAAR